MKQAQTGPIKGWSGLDAYFGPVRNTSAAKLSTIIVDLLLLAWFFIFPLHHKIIFTLCALAFSMIEYTWTACSIVHSDKTLTINFVEGFKNIIGRPSKCAAPHTTRAQFVANVLSLPLILPLYDHLVTSVLVRIALFPLTYWG
eukprot:GEMP01092039.1.p1 GENE.GEMP01092039.1~~GEMP01092039.1.p1  ORF type:complete len:143 (+),score=15.45 GEMP01092039.1:132-560(+)